MLTDIASVATIITAIFVIISVWCIWRQLRESTRLARAANAQSLVEISSPFTMGLVQDRSMAELWLRGAHDFAAMDAVDQQRYRSMLTWWLILQENIFYQHQKRLLDADIYWAWDADLATFVRQQNLAFHWAEMTSNFLGDFARHVQALIEEGAPPSLAS
jgi:hypothetical protein